MTVVQQKISEDSDVQTEVGVLTTCTAHVGLQRGHTKLLEYQPFKAYWLRNAPTV